jgi:transcriptional regulator with XRE-family HTH domain
MHILAASTALLGLDEGNYQEEWGPLVIEENVAFRKRLVDARTRKGMSMRALGAQIGVSSSAVSHWENGIRGKEKWPDYLHLVAISRIFGMSLTELMSDLQSDGDAASNDFELEMLRLLRKMTPSQCADFQSMAYSIVGDTRSGGQRSGIEGS